MNEFAKTGVFLGGAVLLAALATLTGPRSQPHALFVDEGTKFFEAFTEVGGGLEVALACHFRVATKDMTYVS